MATIFELYLEQGSDFTQSLDITGDYTIYTISGKMVDDEGTLLTGFVSWTDDSEGQFDLEFTNVQTAAMISGVGSYDIEIESPTGTIDKILKGRVYIDKEVA